MSRRNTGATASVHVHAPDKNTTSQHALGDTSLAAALAIAAGNGLDTGMRLMNESRISVNDIGLELYEWPAPAVPGSAAAAPTAFFAHATGFHARCWDQVVERLPGIHCFAIDMRGHGLSDKPEPPYHWPDFGRDVAATARYLGLEDALAVGHSKGGYAVTIAAAQEPGAFAKLLLIDPVIMAREGYERVPNEGAENHFAARRRNTWSSPDEMFERFANRPPFARWDPAVLRDYCEYGLLHNPDGPGYVLACPPAIEAATYAGASRGGTEIYDAIPKVDIPVRILRARERTTEIMADMSGSPTWPGLASAFPNAEDVSLPQYTHFLPMEDPGFVAGQVLELFGA